MKIFLTLLAALLIVNLAFAQDLTKKIDSIIKDNYTKNPQVGISVGFIKNGKKYFTAYGNLNAESQISIDENSIFEIASITKILTANLIAQAVIEHKINTDDYIDNYLPRAYNLQENLKQKIRISDLASHQSGLPDIDFAKLIELDPQQPTNHITQEMLSKIVNDCSKLIDYGKYRYSTIGYTLLGQILENIYGKNYGELVQEKILKPLKMKNTLTKDFNVKNRTVGHNPDGGIQEFMGWNISAPAGLIKSNAFDMISYLEGLLKGDGRIGKAAMLTEHIFYKDAKREMGLAVNITTDDKNTIYLKSGDSMGQSSIICYNRTKNWGIILLLNQRNSKMRQDLLNEIYATVLK